MRIFVCSPYRGNIETNTRLAREYCRSIAMEGHTPVAPHLFYPQFLDDEDPRQRAFGIQQGIIELRTCDEIRVWEPPTGLTEGMTIEVDEALRLKIKLRRMNRYNVELRIPEIHGDLHGVEERLMTGPGICGDCDLNCQRPINNGRECDCKCHFFTQPEGK